MRLSDRWYTILKWCTLVLIPACTTAYVGLSAVWGWPYATEVAKTSAIICTLLGALLGISTAEYNRENNIGIDYSDDQYWEEDEDEKTDENK